jgi:heme-degrading monooxygenase HmoA
MAEFFVWVTTRRIKEGALEDLRKAWEPPAPPEGMRRAFEWVGADGRTVVGVSYWDSEESCDRYRSSDAEAERRERMTPFVESEESATYAGRELSIPGG